MKELAAAAGDILGRLSPLVTGIIRAVVVLGLSGFGIKLGEGLLDRFFAVQWERNQVNDSKRKTITSLLKSILRYVIYFIAGINILDLLGINTASLLTAAGVGGLAVGFGAQNLVKDVIAGFFIIFEDQYNVGDYVEAAGVAGIVDEIGLRTTTLKDFGGEIHIIPNGEISLVTNHSRDTKRALVKISIAYEEDLDRAIKVLGRACEKVKAERYDIVDGPTVLGISSFEASHVEITIVARTVSMKQWEVERALRRAILDRFGREGINIPYPKTVILSSEPDDKEGKN